jgi:hypothetical protein
MMNNVPNTIFLSNANISIISKYILTCIVSNYLINNHVMGVIILILYLRKLGLREVHLQQHPNVLPYYLSLVLPVNVNLPPLLPKKGVAVQNIAILQGP